MSLPARLVVTGSGGLIGSEVCAYFDNLGWEVHGVDNNQRAVFFGPAGDTRWNQERLARSLANYRHHNLDIRDRDDCRRLLRELRPSAIVHAAAQPSHDLAASIPFEDFSTNAVGTLNLLEAARWECPESPFVHMSTNKVYGDRPNELPLMELETRWEFANPEDRLGISETMSIDRTKHSLFGASKVAADILVQEYGLYFNMPTCCLRGGCLTGPNHSGVQLHGFLSYVVRCNLEGGEYRIFGYRGKQVRDNIHAFDVARFIHAFIEAPRRAEVYNIGGGPANACSILEAFAWAERYSGRPQRYTYVPENRVGDHICYYSDLRKMRAHFPNWDISIRLPELFQQIVASWQRRNQAA
jgi:CDP-paratose 2-epimerase